MAATVAVMGYHRRTQPLVPRRLPVLEPWIQDQVGPEERSRGIRNGYRGINTSAGINTNTGINTNAGIVPCTTGRAVDGIDDHARGIHFTDWSLGQSGIRHDPGIGQVVSAVYLSNTGAADSPHE